MSELIYVVFGSTGSYEDSAEWGVAAYSTELKAKEKLERCQKIADKCYLDQRESDSCFEPDIDEDPEYFVEDSNFRIEGSTYYFIRSIPFVE